MKELVSIIMPSYNTAGFISRSIESVIAQTYEEWELIIVDDCSVDDTDEIVRPFLKDTRIRYIKNEKNSGAALSRNRALLLAKGKWIAFLDSDDLWLPDKLEKQLEFMEVNKYDFSYTGYAEITEEGNDTGVTVTGPKRVGNLKMHVFNFLGCLTVMYNAETVGKIQIPDLKKRNDWAMWLKVVKNADCFFLDKVLSQYRVRKSGSLTHVRGGKIMLLKYHYRLFRECENMNPVMAMFWTIVNLPAGVLKRRIYTSKK